jgi:hypothetical protein
MLNNDDDYIIMLQLNIEELKLLCQTNANIYHICNQTQFWVDKFQHDNLFIPDIELLENKNMIKSYYILKKITFRLKYFRYILPIYIGNDIKHLINTYMITDPPQSLSFKMFYNFNTINVIKINAYNYELIFSDVYDIVETRSITLHELINLLYDGLYNEQIGIGY